MEVRQAYKKVSKKLHPDKNPSQNAEAMFQQVKVAYDVSVFAIKCQRRKRFIDFLSRRFFLLEQVSLNALHSLPSIYPSLIGSNG